MTENICHGYMTATQDPITGEFTETHYAILNDGTVLESAPIADRRDKPHFFGRSKKATVSSMSPAWVRENAECIGNYRYAGRLIF